MIRYTNSLSYILI